MKRIIIIFVLLSSLSFSQTGVNVKAKTFYGDSLRTLSANYLDSLWVKSRVRFNRPTRFDSLVNITGDARAYGTANYSLSVTGLINFARTETVSVQTRPVMMKLSSFFVSPSVSLVNSTDYHLMDINLSSIGSKLNNKVNLYPFESTAQHGDTGTIGDAVAGYFQVNNNAAGTITNAKNIRILLQSNGGGNVTNWNGVSIENPTKTGGGTISNAYGININNITSGTTSNFGIKNEAMSQFAEKVYLGTNPTSVATTADSGQVVIRDRTASTSIGLRYSYNNNAVVYRLGAFTFNINNYNWITNIPTADNSSYGMWRMQFFSENPSTSGHWSLQYGTGAAAALTNAIRVFGTGHVVLNRSTDATSHLDVTNTLTANIFKGSNSRATQLFNADSIGRWSFGSTNTTTSKMRIDNGLFLNVADEYNSRGTKIGSRDSSGYLLYANYGSVTIPAGDTASVYIFGLTTATGHAVVSYNSSTFFTPDTVPMWYVPANDTLRIRGKYGKTISFWIGRK